MINFDIDLKGDGDVKLNIQFTQKIGNAEFRQFLDIAEDIYKALEDYETHRTRDLKKNAQQ